MAKSERQFSAELRSDLKTFYGNSIFVQLLPDMRMTGKKPFDFFVIVKTASGSKFVAVECKKEDGLSFNTDKILNHQWMKLGEIIALGQEAFFVIAFTRFKEIFVASPRFLSKLIETKGKTISYCDFTTAGDYRTMIRKKYENFGTIWEVEKLVNYVPHPLEVS